MPIQKPISKVAEQEQLIEAHVMTSEAFDLPFLRESARNIWRKFSLNFMCTQEDVVKNIRIASYLKVYEGRIFVIIASKIIDGPHIRQINLDKINKEIRELCNKQIPIKHARLIELQIKNIELAHNFSELNPFFTDYIDPSSISVADANSDINKITALLTEQPPLQESLDLFTKSVSSKQSVASLLITQFLYSDVLACLKKPIPNLEPTSLSDIQIELNQHYTLQFDKLKQSVQELDNLLKRLKVLLPGLENYTVNESLNDYLSSSSLSIIQYEELKTISKKIEGISRIIDELRNSISQNYSLNMAFINVNKKLIKLIDCHFAASYIPGLGTKMSKESLLDSAHKNAVYYTGMNQGLTEELKRGEPAESLNCFCKHALQRLAATYGTLILDKSTSRLTLEEDHAREAITSQYQNSVDRIVMQYRQFPCVDVVIKPFLPAAACPSSSKKLIRTPAGVSREMQAEQSKLAAVIETSCGEPHLSPAQDIFVINVKINGREYELSPANNLHQVGDAQNIYVTNLEYDFGDLRSLALRNFIGRNSRANNGLKQHYPEWIALKRGESPDRYIFVNFQIQGRNIYIPYKNYSHTEYEALINQHRGNLSVREAFLQQALRAMDIQEVRSIIPKLA